MGLNMDCIYLFIKIKYKLYSYLIPFTVKMSQLLTKYNILVYYKISSIQITLTLILLRLYTFNRRLRTTDLIITIIKKEKKMLVI